MLFKHKVILTIIIIISMVIFLISTFHLIINMYSELMNTKHLRKYLDDAEKVCEERLKDDKQG